ncbi:hypothetical protein EG329_010387 [Mollisiaceae sp. DMI_Dod_QoI]|nr:hypothetical protein EG329_010387 [Helotiales sp. DMI_Dod_QoI]
MGSPRPHNFWIRREGSRNERWNWLVVDANDVAKYSGRLGRQVKDDEQIASSQVELCDGVTEDAMKIIISSIPSEDDDGDLPALSINDRDPEAGFGELLSLAIGCWKYDCAIPLACEKFAKDFYQNWTTEYKHDFYEGASGIDVSKAINWMFIALVFKWERIFRNASRFVVEKYSMNENNLNLPLDFQALIRTNRIRKMQQTYGFVQKSWMSFYDPSTHEMLNGIHTHFKTKLGVELQTSSPKNLPEQVNPDTLLVELAAVVKNNEGDLPRIPPPPLAFVAPTPGLQTRGTGRGSPFAPAAASFTRELWEAVKKKMKPKGHSTKSPSSSSSEQSWKQTQSLEKNMNDFRTKHLDGMLLTDEEFMSLRDKHIKPTVSGFQPKIKRH